MCILADVWTSFSRHSLRKFTRQISKQLARSGEEESVLMKKGLARLAWVFSFIRQA
jgi:hypothetical protein